MALTKVFFFIVTQQVLRGEHQPAEGQPYGGTFLPPAALHGVQGKTREMRALRPSGSPALSRGRCHCRRCPERPGSGRSKRKKQKIHD